MFQQRFASQATQEKWNEAKMKKVITKMMKNSAKQIYVRDNCHPAKASIMILTQIPLWISVSLSLRNMTGAISSNFYLDPNCVVPTLSDGGTLWFTNLVLPDPLYILPLAVGLLNLINIELQTLNVREGSKFPKLVTNMLRGLSIIIIPIAAYMPSAITLYWMTSASYSVAQNLFLKLPKVRLALNLVPKSTMNDGQIKNIRTLIKDKYSSSKTNKVK
ncbi:cytochrome c oxidase assembly protein COX18, mitochondrial-like isoform X2 [Antedon mediterranea]